MFTQFKVQGVLDLDILYYRYNSTLPLRMLTCLRTTDVNIMHALLPFSLLKGAFEHLCSTLTQQSQLAVN